MGGCRGSRGKLSKRRPVLKWTHPFDKVLSVFQRFSDMAYTLNQIVHTLMFLTYVFTLFKAFHLELPSSNATVRDFDPGMLKFMTIWNLQRGFWSGLLWTAGFTHMPSYFSLSLGLCIFADPSKMMMREGLLAVFHVIASVQSVFTTYYGFFVMDVPPDVSKMFTGYAGKFKFLTFWNLILQAIFFLICMLNDWFGTNAVNPKKPPLIRKFKDFLHASLGFPIAAFVTIVFWSLMFIDRELVFPKVLDPYFPWWLNHLMHTTVFISTLIEMIMAPRQYPRRLVGVSTVAFFGFIYLVWVHVIHYKSGIWVYPLLPLMSVPVRMLFMASMIVVNAILYFMGEAIDNFVWGNEHNKQQQKSHVKSK